MFAKDVLAAWLAGLLADAGREKLATLVLGSAQERAAGARDGPASSPGHSRSSREVRLLIRDRDEKSALPRRKRARR